MSLSNITAPGRPQTREMYEAEQAALAHRTQINTGGYASETVANGRVETERRPAVAVAYARDVDYSMVTVNGMAMKREQYIRLLEDGSIPPGAKVDDPHARRMAAEDAASSPFAEPVARNAQGDGVNERDAKANTPADPATEAIFTSGQSALDQAREAVGTDTVESLIGEAVESGDMTAIASALEGSKVTAEQMGRIAAAYVASAHEMTANAGISVETMAEVLSDDDLRAARQAVVQGDTERMRTLANKAVDELASLPVKSPERFAEYIDQKFPGLVYEVQNGRTVVPTNRGWMPFDNLVRTGLLCHATLVPMED